MTKVTIVDTGPLVAALDQAEPLHAWAADVGIEGDAITCEAVLTEASYLLRGVSGGPARLLAMVSTARLRIAFDLQEEAESVAALMKKYSDRPMSLADACLVKMSERFENSVVLTVDSDFFIYRRFGRRTIPTSTPPGLRRG